ncbi:hypothetical protein IE53DRAFT_384388 [Violaceomyces palustris]|uniref:Uncharacterized protein n=1 Tax=Violaceomyces palustris TaxID=1673888 RepID=A0ACD0P598_9BASI|nr:hypothetical protein IE53DRAFT_384388 [Violaceomyces palustris]
MAHQSRPTQQTWSSSRVARLKEQQQQQQRDKNAREQDPRVASSSMPPTTKTGTSASRWAPSSMKAPSNSPSHASASTSSSMATETPPPARATDANLPSFIDKPLSTLAPTYRRSLAPESVPIAPHPHSQPTTHSALSDAHSSSQKLSQPPRSSLSASVHAQKRLETPPQPLNGHHHPRPTSFGASDTTTARPSHLYPEAPHYSARSGPASDFGPKPSAHPGGSLRGDGLKPRDTLKPLGGKIDPMALLSSPSRGIDNISIPSDSTLSSSSSSGGIDVAADLTQPETQEKYRDYISDRIRVHRARNPIPLHFGQKGLTENLHWQDFFPALSNSQMTTPLDSTDLTRGGIARKEEEQQKREFKIKVDREREGLEETVLLIRKLREGCTASHRLDGFVLDVYDLSIYLSILALNTPQLSSSLPRLVLDLYPALPCPSLGERTNGKSTEDVLCLFSGSGEIAGAQHTADLKRRSINLGPSFDPCGSQEMQSNVEIIKRAHMSSLLLLSSMCLGRSGTRIGSTANSSDYEEITSGFSKFQSQRIAIWQHLESISPDGIVPIEAARHIDLARLVYRAFRDCNVFGLSSLLESGQVGTNDPDFETGAKITIWQRSLILQALPILRKRCFKVLARSYLHLPVTRTFVGSLVDLAQETSHDGVEQDANMEERREEEEKSNWVAKALLMGCGILPITFLEDMDRLTVGVDLKMDKEKPRIKKENDQVPDDWDSSFITSSETPEEESETPIEEMRSALSKVQLAEDRVNHRRKVEENRLMRFLLENLPSPSINDAACAPEHDERERMQRFWKERVVKNRDGFGLKVK